MFACTLLPLLTPILLSSAVAAAPLQSNSTSALRARTPLIGPFINNPPDDDGWTIFSSVGLMLSSHDERPCETVECWQHPQAGKNGLLPIEHHQSKRSPSLDASQGLIERDAKVTFDGDGTMHYELVRSDSNLSTPPASYLASRAVRNLRSKLNKLIKRKKSKKNKNRKSKAKTQDLLSKVKNVMDGATILTTITWYTGIDLLNPYCGRKSSWAPTDSSMIVAVTQQWSARPECGEFLEITTADKQFGNKQHSIIARVVDLCGGCIPEVPHADLSKAAFKKLYSLDVGRVKGLKMRRVAPPRRWSTRLYGPKEL